jgi:hypothetical protein
MTNPSAQTPGPDHLAIKTSAQNVTLGPAKAVVGYVAGALVGGLTALGTALADEHVTAGEWVSVALAFIIGSGVTGTAVALKSTTVTFK